jgi:hypothetical protein
MQLHIKNNLHNKINYILKSSIPKDFDPEAYKADMPVVRNDKVDVDVDGDGDA